MTEFENWMRHVRFVYKLTNQDLIFEPQLYFSDIFVLWGAGVGRYLPHETGRRQRCQGARSSTALKRHWGPGGLAGASSGSCPHSQSHLSTHSAESAWRRKKCWIKYIDKDRVFYFICSLYTFQMLSKPKKTSAYWKSLIYFKSWWVDTVVKPLQVHI